MTSSGTYYVYEHWRLDRDECFYVGKGKGGRAYSMKKRNAYHKAICAKLSRQGLAMEVRIVATGLSEESAFALEMERIKFWRGFGVDLANMTNGGEGPSGRKVSEEQKIKLSIANKGKKRSEETKRKLSEARKRWSLSDEAKEKISKSLKGRTAHCQGRKLKPETIAILSEKAKLRGFPKLSKEAQEKASAWHRGRKRSAETCARISAAKKGKPSWAKGKPSKLKGVVRPDDFKEKISAAKKLYWEKRRVAEGGKITGRRLTDEEKANLSAKKKAYWALKKEMAGNDN